MGVLSFFAAKWYIDVYGQTDFDSVLFSLFSGVDDVQSGRLDDAQSSGRVSDADPQVYYFDKPTPGAANPAVGLKGPAPTPVFSVSSGYLEGGGKVFITCPGASWTLGRVLYAAGSSFLESL